MAYRSTSLGELSRTSFVRFGRLKKSRWVSMAYSIPITILKQNAVNLEWAVGVKCMAEFHSNGCGTGDSVGVGMEAREIAVRDGFRFS